MTAPTKSPTFTLPTGGPTEAMESREIHVVQFGSLTILPARSSTDPMMAVSAISDGVYRNRQSCVQGEQHQCNKSGQTLEHHL